MKTRLGLIGATVAVVAGVAAYTQVARSDSTPAPITAQVTRGSIVDTVDATGTIQPVTTVQVGTQVSGTIKSLAADFNTTVRQGQVIAVLEPSLFQTQVEQARATVAKLQADAERAAVDVRDTQAKLRRARELSAQQLISASDLDTAIDGGQPGRGAGQVGRGADRPGARAAGTGAGEPRAHHHHRADRRHRHLAQRRRRPDRGRQHAGADALRHRRRPARTCRCSPAWTRPTSAASQQGQPVTFTVDAYPGETFTGTVVAGAPAAHGRSERRQLHDGDRRARTRSLKLKPGMTANVSDRDRARRRRAARAGRGAALPAAVEPSAGTATRAGARAAGRRVWVLDRRRDAAVARAKPG